MGTQHIIMGSAAAKPVKAKKAAKPAAHPPYAAMIVAAIKTLGEKKGSSRAAIKKAVIAGNKVDAVKAVVRINLALKKLVAGKKGAGCFKLPAKEPKAKKPKAKKPKAKKKPSAKKPAAKKAKKPAAKKAAKK